MSRKSLGIDVYPYLKHPDTGEELYKEDKVIKALEKKSIKEWAMPSTIKTSMAQPRKFLKPTAIRHETPPWNALAIRSRVHIQGVIKK